MKRRDFLLKTSGILGSGALLKGCSGGIKLPLEPGNDFSSDDNQICGTWSPDGSEILYCSDRDNYDSSKHQGIKEDYDLWKMNKDGSGKMNLYPFQNTVAYITRVMYPDWSIRDRIIFELAYVDDADNKCDSKLFVIRANGGLYDEIKLANMETNLSYPSWSPDGDYFAFNFDGHIWKSAYPLQGTPLKLDEGFDFTGMPSWSPNGNRIAFLGIPNGSNNGPNIYTVDVNSFEIKPITKGNHWDKYPSWSQNSNHIAFSSDRDNGNKNIWKVKSDGSMEGLEQLTNGLTDILPKYSPDGDKLLYSSKRIGRWGVYLI